MALMAAMVAALVALALAAALELLLAVAAHQLVVSATRRRSPARDAIARGAGGRITGCGLAEFEV